MRLPLIKLWRYRYMLLSLVFYIPISLFAADVEWPNTPAARHTRSWIEALNTDGDEAMKTFIAQSFSRAAIEEKGADNIAMQFLRVKRQTGKLKVESVVDNGDSAIATVTAETNGMKLQVTGIAEKQPPNHLVGVAVKLAK